MTHPDPSLSTKNLIRRFSFRFIPFRFVSFLPRFLSRRFNLDQRRTFLRLKIIFTPSEQKKIEKEGRIYTLCFEYRYVSAGRNLKALSICL